MYCSGYAYVGTSRGILPTMDIWTSSFLLWIRPYQDLLWWICSYGHASAHCGLPGSPMTDMLLWICPSQLWLWICPCQDLLWWICSSQLWIWICPCQDLLWRICSSQLRLWICPAHGGYALCQNLLWRIRSHGYILLNCGYASIKDWIFNFMG